jgi:hypothetical protein
VPKQLQSWSINCMPVITNRVVDAGSLVPPNNLLGTTCHAPTPPPGTNKCEAHIHVDNGTNINCYISFPIYIVSFGLPIHANFNVNAIQSPDAPIKEWCICCKIMVHSSIVAIGWNKNSVCSPIHNLGDMSNLPTNYI